jgi:hypothetical protein
VGVAERRKIRVVSQAFIQPFSKNDNRFEEKLEKAKSTLATAKKDGSVSRSEAQVVSLHLDAAADALEGFKGAKDGVAIGVGVVGAAAAGFFARAIPGIGHFASVPAGSAAYTALRAAVEGGGYSRGEVVEDLAKGAVFGGIMTPWALANRTGGLGLAIGGSFASSGVGLAMGEQSNTWKELAALQKENLPASFEVPSKPDVP